MGEKAKITSKPYLSLFIVVLIVVVVGAAFMKTYQTTITDLWSSIMKKIKSSFGL